MTPERGPTDVESGWRLPRGTVSLPEVHATIPIPTTGFARKFIAFAGPGYLVAVGYMDPGNWATDLAGGARFGYALLSVIMLSNLMAVLLQALGARLGIVSGRDLAQACRDAIRRPRRFVLWVLCEIAIAACDLAEVIGAAIALEPAVRPAAGVGRLPDALDVLLVLLSAAARASAMSRRWSSALIVAIGGSFAIEIVSRAARSRRRGAGFVPDARASCRTPTCSTSPSASSARR